MFLIPRYPTLTCQSPQNVLHSIHVDFDTETGFRGLPAEWQKMVTESISIDEVRENPEGAEGRIISIN